MSLIYNDQHWVVSQASLTFQKGKKTFPRVSHRVNTEFIALPRAMTTSLLPSHIV